MKLSVPRGAAGPRVEVGGSLLSEGIYFSSAGFPSSSHGNGGPQGPTSITQMLSSRAAPSPGNTEPLGVGRGWPMVFQRPSAFKSLQGFSREKQPDGWSPAQRKPS